MRRIHNAALVSTGTYRGRRAVSIDTEHLRVTVLVEGGHIAEVFDKATGINPLWTPPWPSIEPSTFDPKAHGESYGAGSDGKLLAGIMGHNLCLDIFGGPSEDEAAAGVTAHGEASIAPYEIRESGTTMTLGATLPLAQVRFERRIQLHTRVISVRERIESRCAFDRPIGWTEHVTLGPPFLEKGRTEFRASATQSRVFESQFGVADYLRPGACFEWPAAPRLDGGLADLRMFTDAPASSAYTAHLMDPASNPAFFVAFAPAARLAFGYVWMRVGLPLDGDLGGEQESVGSAVARRDAHARNGIRRVAVSGNATTNGGSRTDVRHTHVPMAARERRPRGPVLDRAADG